MTFPSLWSNGLVFSPDILSLFPADSWQTVAIILLGVFAGGMLIPYLLGSINSAVILSRLLYRDDVRNHGSGNAGMTNMLRTYGKGAAGLTLLGDVLKTVLAVFSGCLLAGAWLGGWVAALFCVLGHIFPIYYRFRGGKGVLCAATAIAMLSPFVFLIMLAVFVILVAMTRYVSLGSTVAAMLLPLLINTENSLLAQGGYTPGGWNGIISIFIALLVIWCHRSNLKRISEGKESKLSFKKKEKPMDGGSV